MSERRFRGLVIQLQEDLDAANARADELRGLLDRSVENTKYQRLRADEAEREVARWRQMTTDAVEAHNAIVIAYRTGSNRTPGRAIDRMKEIKAALTPEDTQ